MPPARIDAEALVDAARAVEGGGLAHVRLAGSQHALSRRRRPPAGAARARSPSDAAVPLIAVNDVLYHAPERRPLQDVVTCIREHVTHRDGRPAARSQCRAASEIAARDGAAVPHARRRRSPRRCVFSTAATSRSMSCASTEYPDETAPGLSPRRRRRWSHLLKEGVQRRYPNGMQAESPRRARQGARDHRRARIRAVLPHRPRHRATSRARRASSARAAARRRIPSSAIASASPRSTPRRSISCSSASSPPSATSRPTSTSISSTSGARR